MNDNVIFAQISYYIDKIVLTGGVYNGELHPYFIYYSCIENTPYNIPP